MADIRIKDLTTTASSTASDDFIAVDGTTNGTRKLNAFSPTFGGNATVTGTLTVSGTTIRSSNTISVDSGNTSFRYDIYRDGAGTYQLGHLVAYGSQTGFGGFTWANLDFGKLWEISNQGNGVLTGTLKVNSTTASTTTSTGALVVGNGTSGGLGVGGNIYAGGNVVSTAAGGKFLIFGTGNTTESKELTFKRSDDADNFTLGLTGSAYAGSLTGLGNNEAFLYNSNASAFRIFIGTLATNRYDFTSSQFKINATTASTTTSSGALVVSGGVGVAKEMYIGGGLLNVAKGGAGSTIEINADSGFASKLAMQRAATNRWTLEVDSSDVLTLKSLGTTAALTMTGTTSAEFVGSIKTAAPSGGTAAAWKLGTVATVSPTSPNRTIEVDIGGTIYYIAAKTTNN